MAQGYFIIGGIIGLIFAVACVFLGVADGKALNKIVSKNNQTKVSHATMIFIALIVNVLIWPIIVGFLGKLLWKKLSIPQQP